MFKASFTRSTLILSSIGLALGLTVQMAEAAPLLRIPDQSFLDVVGFNGNEPIRGTEITNKTHELYDNKTGDGGGSASTNAIKGTILANSLTYDGGGLVTGFTIRATITNDLPPKAVGYPAPTVMARQEGGYRLHTVTSSWPPNLPMTE